MLALRFDNQMFERWNAHDIDQVPDHDGEDMGGW